MEYLQLSAFDIHLNAVHSGLRPQHVVERDLVIRSIERLRVELSVWRASSTAGPQ